MNPKILSTGCAALVLCVSAPANASPPTNRPPSALAHLAVTVTGDGTVTSSPAGIACPDTCSAGFERGITVTLTASPAESGTFLTFTGDCAGTQPTCDVHVANAMTVKAYFDSVAGEDPVVEPPDEEPAPVPQTGNGVGVGKTGQTDCYGGSTGKLLVNNRLDCAGTGQDGELQTGAASPDPRFTDQADGTVKDNLTGLVWTKSAGCIGPTNWSQALASANLLATETACDLTDGSQAGDWRLPNVKEFLSLLSYQAIDMSQPAVALPVDHPFNIMGSGCMGYWTSTTLARDYATHNAYVVALDNGGVSFYEKSNQMICVWTVRD